MNIAEAKQLKAGDTIYFHGDINVIAWRGIDKGTFVRYVSDEAHILGKINRPKNMKAEGVVVIYRNRDELSGWAEIRLSRAFLTRQDAVISAENKIRNMNDPVYLEKYRETEDQISEIMKSAREKIYLSAREQLEISEIIERNLNT